MNELIVKKSNFDESLKNLDKLSKKNKSLPQFQKFQEKSGPFELFDSKVKGSDMNQFASQIQESFVLVNEKINMFYKQFIEIYNAFDSLDKEYISGIVAAFNQAIEATKKAEDAQNEINKTVLVLKNAVEKMKEFNTKVSYELSMIDGDNWRENALKHKEELDYLDQRAEFIIDSIKEYENTHKSLLSQLQSYQKEKKSYKRNLKFCWFTSTLMFITTVILIVLMIIGVF